jgi:tetratricopeptide (TPR) repeat protein
VLFPSAGIAPEAELRTGDTYLAERNFAEARKRYQTAAATPEPLVRYEAQYSLALVDQREGELGLPRTSSANWRRRRLPGRWAQAARIRLAQIRSSAGDHAAAIGLLRETLAEKPEPATRDEASLALAEALMEQGEWGKAEVELKELVARAPDSPRAAVAAVHAARARLEQMDAAGAVAGATAALAGELEPDVRAAALAVRGRAELRLKNASGAATLRKCSKSTRMRPWRPTRREPCWPTTATRRKRPRRPRSRS